MTDITSVFYNAWCAVMGEVEYQIFCSWHVDHAWKMNMNKIINKEKRETVYHALKVLQTELKEDCFLVQLERFVKILHEDPDTVNFGKYFVEHYSNKYQQWAYAYRKSAGINTNMHLESMHKCIKYFHLGGTVVKRLDKGIHAVNSYIRDKIIGRMIKELKGNNNIHLNKIDKRHSTALKSAFEVTEEGNVWQIKCEEKVYIISKNELQVPCCQLKCDICNVCIHMYSCTCIDYFIKCTICKHIHFLAIFDKKCNDPNTENQKVDNLVNTLHEQNNSCSTSSEIDLHIKTVATSQKPVREILKQQLFEAISLDFSLVDDSIIEQALKLQKSVNLLLKGNIDLSKALVTPIPGASHHEPGNKKIIKQNFFSTKKKKSVKPRSVSKPTSDQSALIKSTLLSEEFILKEINDEHNYA